MQEPLARGEVLVAWDHVARLVSAPKDNPEDWIMAGGFVGKARHDLLEEDWDRLLTLEARGR